jgi:hypothetical protein
LWCSFGFSPDTFLDQTAATFAASLRGRAKVREHEAERDLSLAWHTGAFVGAAYAGKLKRLSEYQGKKQSSSQQKPGDMLAVLKMLRDKGAPMNIRQIN